MTASGAESNAAPTEKSPRPTPDSPHPPQDGRPWYARRSDEDVAVIGPITFARLQALAASGALLSTAWVSRDGTTWFPASGVKELRLAEMQDSLSRPPRSTRDRTSSATGQSESDQRRDRAKEDAINTVSSTIASICAFVTGGVGFGIGMAQGGWVGSFIGFIVGHMIGGVAVHTIAAAIEHATQSKA